MTQSVHMVLSLVVKFNHPFNHNARCINVSHNEQSLYSLSKCETIKLKEHFILVNFTCTNCILVFTYILIFIKSYFGVDHLPSFSIL